MTLASTWETVGLVQSFALCPPHVLYMYSCCRIVRSTNQLPGQKRRRERREVRLAREEERVLRLFHTTLKISILRVIVIRSHVVLTSNLTVAQEERNKHSTCIYHVILTISISCVIANNPTTSHTMLVQLPKRLMGLGSGVVCRVNLGVLFCRCRSGQAPSCRLKWCDMTTC